MDIKRIFISIFLMGVCRGQGATYTHTQGDLDTLASQMKEQFESYGMLFETFDVKLNALNASLRADTMLLYSSLEKFMSSVTQGQNLSQCAVNEIGQLTSKQLDDVMVEISALKNDTAKVTEYLVRGQEDSRTILNSIEAMTDFADFQTRTETLLSVQSNLTTILNHVEMNRQNVTNGILGVKEEMVTVFREKMSDIRSVVDRVQSEVSELEGKLRTMEETQSVCPRNWESFKDSCYVKVDKPSSWKLAKFICRQMDSFLVEMYTGDEKKYVSAMVGNKTEGIWTGANTRRGAEWRWEESNSEVDVSMFTGECPSGRNRAYCGFFIPIDMSLGDSRCTVRRPFVCRKISVHM